MKKVFSYYRVSSKEQEEGASLEAQRIANARYAKEQGLEIVEEFKEIQSASKASRKQFDLMIKKLDSNVKGIIFHDVDRSTRSIKDLARIHELMQSGFEIHFSRDNLRVDSRSDILMMNIKGVLAADFITNLRQEVKKGMYKRLEDGCAVVGQPPIGYLPKGGGIRVIDPIQGPLVAECFKLYASGKYSLDTLADTMYKNGLRLKSGKKIEREKMSKILNNKFYIGLMLVRGKYYPGKYEPLVSVELFNKVQAVLGKKHSPKVQKNDYKFQHLFTCAVCKKPLRATTAKKLYHYYICRNRSCRKTNIPEAEVERLILAEIAGLQFTEEEVIKMVAIVKETRASFAVTIQERERILKLQLDVVNNKLSQFIDFQMTSTLPADVLAKKNNDLMLQKQTFESQIDQLKSSHAQSLNGLEELVKLLQNPVYAYQKANPRNKQSLIERMMTNIVFGPNSFTFEWQTPFLLLAGRRPQVKS